MPLMKGQTEDDSWMEYGLLIMEWGATNERTEDDSWIEYGLLIMHMLCYSVRTLLRC